MVICVLTYQRPQGLTRLLDSLAGLNARPDGSPIEVLIVDNDASGSARSIAEGWDQRPELRVRYVIEPQRGIASARNRAVEESRDHDIVVFVDDDEWVEPDWLDELLGTMQRTGADVVTGPVNPVFEPGAPDWLTRGGFFTRPVHSDGERLQSATTSSVAIRTSALDENPFDTRFDLSGGSDTQLFHRMRLSGATICWSERALVHELIPNSRVNPEWLIRRQYRRGLTLSRCLRMLEDSPSRRLKRLCRALVEAARGSGRLAVGIVRGRTHRLRGRTQLAFAWGLVAGLFGVKYDEYATVHGR